MSQSTRILAGLVLGLIAGIVVAAFAPGAVEPTAAVAQPIGTTWLNALQMTVVPLVFALLVTGVAATAEAAQAGRLAGRAVGLYVAIMGASAVAAAFLTPLFLSLAPLPAESAAALRGALAGAETVPAVPSLVDFFTGIVPSNVVKAIVDSNFLSMIIFALIFAFALMRIAPELRGQLIRLFTGVRDAMLVIVEWVLWVGPIGVFALAYVVGAKAGSGAFQALIHYILTVWAVGITVTLIALPMAMFGGRIPLGKFLRASLPSQAVAISTQSSIASLPQMLASAGAMGVPVRTAGVTLPLAVALLRATGPAMNFAVAIYIATWFGIELTPAILAVGAVVAMLTSLGSVSLPGTVSFVSAISPVCATIGAPVAPLGILVAVETLPDIVRTWGNVLWDLATTVTVARKTPAVERDEADEILEEAA